VFCIRQFWQRLGAPKHDKALQSTVHDGVEENQKSTWHLTVSIRSIQKPGVVSYCSCTGYGLDDRGSVLGRDRDLGFEVLTPVVTKSHIFWDVAPYSPLKVNWCVGGTCHLHLQGRRTSRDWYRLHAGLLLCLFFRHEDGDDMFIRNVGWLSVDYTASQKRELFATLPRLTLGASELMSCWHRMPFPGVKLLGQWHLPSIYIYSFALIWPSHVSVIRVVRLEIELACKFHYFNVPGCTLVSLSERKR
jgi:hypothetical protein